MAGDELVSYAYQPRVVVEASIGSLVQSEEGGGEARSWELSSGRKRGEVMVGASDAIGMSSDGRVLLVGHRQRLRALDRVSGKGQWDRDWSAECSKEMYEPCFRALEVSTDGSTAVVGTP